MHSLPIWVYITMENLVTDTHIPAKKAGKCSIYYGGTHALLTCIWVQKKKGCMDFFGIPWFSVVFFSILWLSV